jgi:integrase
MFEQLVVGRRGAEDVVLKFGERKSTEGSSKSHKRVLSKDHGAIDGCAHVGLEPKTERGKRTLPLDDGLVDALTALQLKQRDEQEALNDAYGTCPDCGGDHVVVDELGDPVHPESYSDRFETLIKRAVLPKIRLHDCRHTCGSLMHLRGVPIAVISAWLGHAIARFTMGVYVHSQDDALRAAGATLTSAIRPTSKTTTP